MIQQDDYSGVRRGPWPDLVRAWSLALCLRAITLLGVGPIWLIFFSGCRLQP